jgi:response regulator of citrate/malate metabolism
MKKSTMQTIASYINDHNIAELMNVYDEIVAELAKGETKAQANRAIYEEIHDAVIETLKSATAPVTAQELADETGYAKGKIVYGLRNYWANEVEKIEGKVNAYTLKG